MSYDENRKYRSYSIYTDTSILRRIKKRFVDDKYFDRKIAILSKLYSMGSIVIKNGNKRVKD